MLVISDTSPLSCLIKTGKLDLLQQLYKQLVILFSVYRETLDMKSFGYDVSGFEKAPWIEVMQAHHYERYKNQLSNLDAGEAEAIALALEIKADLILIDERLGAATAIKMGLNVTGTLGIVVDAKERGIIKSGKELIDELRTKGGLWISAHLYNSVLDLLNEK
jgi:hypothetical protein